MLDSTCCTLQFRDFATKETKIISHCINNDKTIKKQNKQRGYLISRFSISKLFAGTRFRDFPKKSQICEI